VTAYAREARRRGVRVVLNAAPARKLSAELLSCVDVLIANEGEIAVVTGHREGIRDRLATLGIPSVVVTLGARGCYAWIDGEQLIEPAFHVEPVDTTAAGDTFCGVLVASLANGLGSAEVLRAANAAAALACTKPGAQSSIPTQAEVQALLASSPP